MNDQGFIYDVFLSHSGKDKVVMLPLAERLRQDGLKVRVNFDFRNSEFGFVEPDMSANAFGSNLAPLTCPAMAAKRRREAGTCGWGNLPLRDLLNQERHSSDAGFDIPIWHFKPNAP